MVPTFQTLPPQLVAQGILCTHSKNAEWTPVGSDYKLRADGLAEGIATKSAPKLGSSRGCIASWPLAGERT
ncbi:MAG: hypothetical protein IPK82_19815 [Polyangiaceae bacterium]|nr:hypothetical protein [Polyangiaceae bacterium]